ncbi:hypothetical protein F5Y10DRAFT_238154 [Nemania abortiva]|nr:hypothetical protein F5Y10DRAFT_238154 [Nemania abortiva]
MSSSCFSSIMRIPFLIIVVIKLRSARTHPAHLGEHLLSFFLVAPAGSNRFRCRSQGDGKLPSLLSVTWSSRPAVPVLFLFAARPQPRVALGFSGIVLLCSSLTFALRSGEDYSYGHRPFIAQPSIAQYIHAIYIHIYFPIHY